MHRLTSIAVALGLFFAFPSLTGCAGSTCDPPPSPAAFEVGTGDTCFERPTPGQTLSVMQGAQGGYHLWTSVGCADCPEKTVIEYGVKDAETKEWLNGAPVKQVATLDSSGWPQEAGLRGFLPGDPFGEKPADQRPPVGLKVLLSMRAFDSSNKELHQAEVLLTLGETVVLPSSCSNCR